MSSTLLNQSIATSEWIPGVWPILEKRAVTTPNNGGDLLPLNLNRNKDSAGEQESISCYSNKNCLREFLRNYLTVIKTWFDLFPEAASSFTKMVNFLLAAFTPVFTLLARAMAIARALIPGVEVGV